MKKILVIEDNLEVRENLVELLELSNYDVQSAENGKIGVKKALEFIPDLILCDVMMPELDGFGVLKILEGRKELKGIPFVFLTAKAEKEDFRKGMNLGADDYITKPFDDVELLDAVEMRLKKSTKGIGSMDGSFLQSGKAEKELEELVDGKEVRHYIKKEAVIREGEKPRYVFLVKKGMIKQVRSNDSGKELIVRIFTEGDYFGYQLSSVDDSYPESAKALVDSSLVLIPGADFEKTLQASREVGLLFNRFLSEDLAEKEKRLIHLAYDSTRKKVAEALVYFESKVGTDSFELPREDLAALAGVAKESSIRTLTEFKNDKLIQIDKNRITILDREELASLPY